MTNEAHPDTLIGRRPCTCAAGIFPGLAAYKHFSTCERRIAHDEAVARLPRMVGNPEAHGADE